MLGFCSTSIVILAIRLYFVRDKGKVKFKEEKKAETELKPIE
jgi:hypothetical protein